MALDLEAIRQKLNNLQSQTGKQDNLWKPEPGKNQIRVVPYQFNKDNPFIELYFHYDLGKKNYLSPVTFGESDPAVEFAEKLKATGNQDDWKMARKLEPKMRTYVPIIVRGKESEGVKYWGFGKTVYQELLSIIADPDYGDITDPVNGRDVSVEFISAEESGASFPKTNIRVKPNQTPISDAPEILETVKTQQDIREIYQELSYDDLTEVLNEWLNPSDEEESESKPETVSSEVQSAKVSDTSEAFDELFNS